MLRVFDAIHRAAPTDANVLILGENGTGKELVAREIHRQSRRAKEVFLRVDLGSLSAQVFESELFDRSYFSFLFRTFIKSTGRIYLLPVFRSLKHCEIDLLFSRDLGTLKLQLTPNFRCPALSPS